MDQSDLIYICTTVANLAGVPVRIYENGKQCFYHCVVDLPADPVRLHEKQILALADHISYFATPEFDYYGIVTCDSSQVVLGPTRQTENTDRELEKMAFDLSIASEKRKQFVQAMKNLIRFPLDSFLQMLCSINFMMNHEKLSLRDIPIYGIGLPELPADAVPDPTGTDSQNIKDYPYTGYDTEQQLMQIVSKGDEAAFLAWAKSAPAIRPGIMSSDQLRQIKDLFIVSTALTCRAAVRGGLDGQTAFRLSDAYIRRCELFRDPAQIIALQYEMVLDYIRRVSQVRVGPVVTELSLKAANYIQNHITEVITVDDLARALFLSRARLSARLKAETGMTVVQMIQTIKINEAKRLLRGSALPVNAVSDYLAFSSQSHLTRVFEKYVGVPPAAYRRSIRTEQDA